MQSGHRSATDPQAELQRVNASSAARQEKQKTANVLCFISFIIVKCGVNACVTDLNGALGNIQNKLRPGVVQHLITKYDSLFYRTVGKTLFKYNSNIPEVGQW